MILKIFADFNNADIKGRVRLNTYGTMESIKKNGIFFKKGLEILLSDDDSLEAFGIVEFSEEEKIWVAKIDWDLIKPTTT